MNRKRHIIHVLTLCFMALTSCERDDICPENSTTTPDAQIAFYSTANGREEEADGSDIKFYAMSGTDTLFTVTPRSNGKSILLPIDFESKESVYLMSRDIPITDPATGETTGTQTLTDTITITYNPVLTFISKACGYCFTFDQMKVNCSTGHVINSFTPEIEAAPAYGELLSSYQVVAKVYLITY